ncbi:MAG: oligosaccharide flippase family protein [Oscillospiraceae bacterium]|nr:oligosaccharide flippase family protein [Oscillospiraceae bacterium]
MRKKRLLRNTALLSGSTVLMRLIALAFQGWLAGRVGAAGLGLFQLVCAVSALAATFAISGVRFAATRLVAEELGATRGEGVPAALRRCLGYAGFFGAAAGLILWSFSARIGGSWIGDGRTVAALRLSAFGLPCIALCAAMSGYFTACGRLLRPTLIHLAEQLIGAALAVFFLRRAPRGDPEAYCAAIVCGQLLGDFASLLMMALACRADLRRHFPLRSSGRGQTRRLLTISLPLAASAYARSGLSTAQHLLIPRSLQASGASAESALAGYGVVHGMALPLLLFPSCVLASAAELIVPELTREQVRRDGRRIRRAVRAFLSLSLLFSAAVAALLFLFARPLGLLIFHSGEAVRYIRLLAPLVPVMYADMSVDGCLKGLGQQVWSMGINVLDSLSGLLLVLLLLPRYGLAGYLFVIFATETLNFLLSSLRLIRVCRAGPEAAGRRSPERPGQTA